jgi:hypothetical protein
MKGGLSEHFMKISFWLPGREEELSLCKEECHFFQGDTHPFDTSQRRS